MTMEMPGNVLFPLIPEEGPLKYVLLFISAAYFVVWIVTSISSTWRDVFYNRRLLEIERLRLENLKLRAEIFGLLGLEDKSELQQLALKDLREQRSGAKKESELFKSLGAWLERSTKVLEPVTARFRRSEKEEAPATTTGAYVPPPVASGPLTRGGAPASADTVEVVEDDVEPGLLDKLGLRYPTATVLVLTPINGFLTILTAFVFAAAVVYLLDLLGIATLGTTDSATGKVVAFFLFVLCSLWAYSMASFVFRSTRWWLALRRKTKEALGTVGERGRT